MLGISSFITSMSTGRQQKILQRDVRAITEPAAALPIPSLQTRVDAAASPEKIANPALARAVSLHLDGQLTAAVAELRSAIDAGGRQPSLYSALGHILCELREFEQAAKYYTTLLEF